MQRAPRTLHGLQSRALRARAHVGGACPNDRDDPADRGPAGKQIEYEDCQRLTMPPHIRDDERQEVDDSDGDDDKDCRSASPLRTTLGCNHMPAIMLSSE
jgi:hypothetical protein